MKRFVGVLVAVTLLASVCLLSVVFSQGQSELANQHKIMHRLRNDPDEDKNKDEHPAEAGKAAKARPGSNGITYHGGPVILGTTNVYYIWYGNWSGNSATTILTDFAGSIGGSPYFNINTTYYDSSNTHVLNAVVFHGSMVDNYSHGTSLSDSAIQAIVSSAISSNALPNDTNGIYFVLTSADVTASSGFCTQYCGWHTHGTIADPTSSIPL